MTEARVRLTDDLLAVVDAMRGSEPRSRFLAFAIRKGVRTIHAEATKNAPRPAGGLGMAPLKVEGESAYFDFETVERIQALIDRLAY